MTHARARTISHLQRLVATATAATTAASCSRTDDVKTVTITPLPQPSTTVAEVPLPTASATLTAPDPPPPPPPDPSGYLVVDMLPAPARCLGIASHAKATGKFHRDAGGMMLDVTIAIASGAPHGATFTGQAPQAWSGVVMSSSFRSQNSVAVARVKLSTAQSGATTTGVTFPVSCGPAGTGSLAATVAYTSPPADGASATISLQDY